MLLELIAGAQQCFKMLMYMFNPDQVGDAVRDALIEAAARGVEVQVLIDGFGSAAPQILRRRSTDAGGKHCVFNPSYGRRYLLRNHQKLIVIDDRTAIIGGANIDDSYLSDRGVEALARPVASHRWPEVAMPQPLFRHAVPLVDAAGSRLQYARRMARRI